MRNDRGNVECRFVAGNLWWQVARCGVSEITIHSLRSNWPGARREGGSVSPAILDRLSNEAPGQFQRNPEGGMSFGRRRRCSLLTDPQRDMLWCPCGSTSRLASAQNPLPRMYSYFGDTTQATDGDDRLTTLSSLRDSTCFPPSVEIETLGYLLASLRDRHVTGPHRPA